MSVIQPSSWNASGAHHVPLDIRVVVKIGLHHCTLSIETKKRLRSCCRAFRSSSKSVLILAQYRHLSFGGHGRSVNSVSRKAVGQTVIVTVRKLDGV